MEASSPPRCPRTMTLPVLMEELVEEILIRIPPDEPAHLMSAALVCKPWRRIIFSDPGFLRRYRAFHRRHPPLLGFFCNDWDHGFRPSFMPVAAAFPSLHFRRGLRILDCHHGRVLVHNVHNDTFIVWDSISDDWQELPHEHGMYCESYCVVVLCAVAGCDHHDCGGGPFLVVHLSTDDIDDTILNASVYSSEPDAWGTPVSYQLDRGCHFGIHRAAVIGDEIYCVFTPGVNIVKYDLVKRNISLLISTPSICSEASHHSPPNVGEDPVLTQNEDGSLGLASIRDSRLYLWSSRMADHDGKLVAECVQERVIDLDKILPIDMNTHTAQVYVSGFAEGVGILFICSQVGTFTIELKSGTVRKITASRNYEHTAFPFISFFTPLSTKGATGRGATSVEPALKKLFVGSPYIKGDCSSN